MDIQIVRSQEADFICHNGRFHADDIFSTVLLYKLWSGQFRLARVSVVPKDIRSGAIVYDIGEGEFDHHQVGGNGCRTNGIPYASFGLLWHTYGETYCQKYSMDASFTIPEFDRFVEGIDAYDNGLFHKDQGPIQNVSNCIAMFNPPWEEESEDATNDAFIRALGFAEVIFENVMAGITSRCHARQILSESLQKSDTLYLSRYMPYSAYPEMRRKISFIVYPSTRGGYNLQIINRDFSFRSDIIGLSGDALRRKTGVGSALFIHNSGRIAGTSEISDIPLLQSFIVQLRSH